MTKRCYKKRWSTSCENIKFDEMTNKHYQRKGYKFLLKKSRQQYMRDLRQSPDYRNAERKYERMQKRANKQIRNSEKQKGS